MYFWGSRNSGGEMVVSKLQTLYYSSVFRPTVLFSSSLSQLDCKLGAHLAHVIDTTWDILPPTQNSMG